MSSPANIPVGTITTLCNNAIQSPIADTPLDKCCTQRCLAQCSFFLHIDKVSDKYKSICANMCKSIEYRHDHTCANPDNRGLIPAIKYNEHKYAYPAGVTFPTFKDDEIQTLVQNAAVHSPWEEDGPIDAGTQKKINTAKNLICKQTCCDNIKKSLNNPPNFPDEACLKGQSTKYSGEIFRMFAPCASATMQNGKCTCTVPIVDRTGNCDKFSKKFGDPHVWKNYPGPIPPLIADYLKSINTV